MAQPTTLHWHHYLVVKSGATVTFYRDGQRLWENKALNVVDKFTNNAIDKIVFGNDDRPLNAINGKWKRHFNGLIKGIQLWDKTFDAAGARALYNGGNLALPDDISQLVAFYPLQHATISDMVVGGQTLSAISLDVAKPYAPGIVGGQLVR